MTDPIRVLFLIAGLSLEQPLGGIERFVLSLAPSLKARGFEIHISGLWSFGTPYEQAWQSAMQDEGISTSLGPEWQSNAPYQSFWRSIRHLRALADQSRFHVLHSHNQFADIVAPFLGTRLEAKAIVRTIHAQVEWKKRPLRKLILSNILYPLQYDAEIGVSPSIVDRLNRRVISRYRHRRGIFLPNAVDLSRFESMKPCSDQIHQSLGIPTSGPIIGTVGRLTEQKGYSDFITAAVHVLKTLPHATFVLIGSGELEHELRALARSLGIQHSVIFAGSRSRIEEILPCFDLFVSSSHWEGLPTAVLEAMSAGVPILATNIPGNRELIKEGISGWNTPPQNSHQLAINILRSIQTSPEEKETLLAGARNIVQEYSIALSADRHAELYRQLLTGPAR